jgi:hypothetical protein
MDGVFRLGVSTIGALVALFGVWQIAYAWAVPPLPIIRETASLGRLM